MKTCPFCSAECKDSATICPRCGKKLIRPNQMRRIEPPPPPPIDPPKSKLSRKEYTALGLVIGGVTGALIALIVLLLLNRPAQVPNTPIVSTDTGNDTQVVTSDEEAAISGAICEAADGVTPVTGAIVNIYKGEQLVASQSSAADGKFEFQLDPDTYTMEISAANHVDFTSAVTVRPNEHTYMETVLLVAGSPTDEGDASGTIVDTVTGEKKEGVQLTFNPGWNNFDAQTGSALWGQSLATTTTDNMGHYEVHLPLGYYTVVLTYDEYLDSAFNIVIQDGMTDNQNGTITPVVSGNAGEGYLVTLTWGENPSDLDSHVQGTGSDGSTFHVYYIQKNYDENGTTVCNLDYDDTDSFGPEHITLKPGSSEPYYYYVYRFNGSGTVGTSGAKVTVHRGNVLVREFNVPVNQGNGDYWNVFAIVNNQLIVRDRIADAAELDYAG